MKTVTVFVGSGRKQRGLTYAATRRFLDQLESYGDVRGEIVYLSEHKLGLCRGCCGCFFRGEERCPLKDERDLLIDKMMRSDGVVFATPNYAFQVSAIMKAFLDRLSFMLHRPRFHGKAFTGIVVQGVCGGSKIESYLRLVGGGLGFSTVKGSCITALMPLAEPARRKMEKTLAAQARRFHQQLCSTALPAPSILSLLAFRMARTSIRLQLGERFRDYTYYRDHGWFESDYFCPTSLGPLKRALGAIFDRIAVFVVTRDPAMKRAVEATYARRGQDADPTAVDDALQSAAG